MPAKPPANPTPPPNRAAARTLANKKRRQARHFSRHPRATEGDPTQHPPRRPAPLAYVVHTTTVPAFHGESWYACILDGRILECGPLSACQAAKRESMDPRAYLIRRTGSTMNRIEA